MPDDQPMEVELKLVATADAMDTLLASPLLREHARSTVRSRNLVTTYYDTNDHRLSRRGLAFRVRQSGKKFIQTLKTASAGDGVAMTRGEWEVELADGTPQLTAFNDPRVLDLTGLVLPDELVPTFETRFRRQAVLIEWPDANRPPAQIEVAFDRGAIRANGGETPICEIELELKRGEPRALFELAQSLRALVPVRLQTQDKAARGYGLVTGAPPAWHKAKPVVLDETMLVEDALQRILGGCVRHWIENEGATREARDPEGLHQLRVALRRLRSALAPVQDGPGRARHAPSWNDESALAAGTPGSGARPRRVRHRDHTARVRARAPTTPISAVLAELVDRTAAGGRTRPFATRWPSSATVISPSASPAGSAAAAGAREPTSTCCWRNGNRSATSPPRSLTQRHRQVRKRGRGFAELEPRSPSRAADRAQEAPLRHRVLRLAVSRAGKPTASARPRPGCRTCSAT